MLMLCHHHIQDSIVSITRGSKEIPVFKIQLYVSIPMPAPWHSGSLLNAPYLNPWSVG